MLSSNQSKIVGPAKFTYCPLDKAFEKQTKATEDQGKYPTKALKSLRLFNIITELLQVEDIFSDNQ